MGLTIPDPRRAIGASPTFAQVRAAFPPADQQRLERYLRRLFRRSGVGQSAVGLTWHPDPGDKSPQQVSVEAQVPAGEFRITGARCIEHAGRQQYRLEFNVRMPVQTSRTALADLGRWQAGLLPIDRRTVGILHALNLVGKCGVA